MADLKQDSNPSTGTAAEPTARDSGGAGDSEDSRFDAAKLQASFDELSSKVDKIATSFSTIQSGKDKATANNQKEINSIKAMLADYEGLKERFGPDGAVEQLELRQTLSEIQNQLQGLTQSVPSNASGTGDKGTVDAAKVITEHGLDITDPMVSILANGRYANEDAVKIAIADYVKASKAAPSPTPAQNPAPSGGTSPAANLTADQVENLSGELNELYKQPTKNAAKIKELEEKLKPYWG